MNVTETAFQPNEHLINLGTSRSPRWYLPVQWRLVWLREQCPEAQISTEVVHLDLEKGIAIFKATVKHGDAIAVAHGSESVKDFRDYIEKAETKACGRALAALGFGTQFASELDEGPRIVDAPVQPTKPQPQREAQEHEAPAQDVAQPAPKTKPTKPLAPAQNGKILPGQYNALKTLYLKQGQEVPPDLGDWSFEQAKAAILNLQAQKQLAE